MTIPTKGTMEQLCKIGLGTRWFTSQDELAIETYLSAEEVHFLFLCLYPPLKNILYELWKKTGLEIL